MKKLFAFITVTTMLATSAQAIECPRYTLNCVHKVLTSSGHYRPVQTIANNFIAFNDDEPSLPPIKCEASVTMSTTEEGKNLHITVSDDLVAFISTSKGYASMLPQFSVNAVPNKEMTIYLQNEQMSCVLK
jgi:hypothetical protein